MDHSVATIFNILACESQTAILLNQSVEQLMFYQFFFQIGNFVIYL